jgi:glycyl-tRNA synthetase alpha subunit
MEVTQFTYFQQVRADVLIAPRQQHFQQGKLLSRYASHMCCAYGTSSSAK